MTEQEAAKRLEYLKLYMQICDNNNDIKFLAEDYEAINIAIKTLLMNEHKENNNE